MVINSTATAPSQKCLDNRFPIIFAQEATNQIISIDYSADFIYGSGSTNDKVSANSLNTYIPYYIKVSQVVLRLAYNPALKNYQSQIIAQSRLGNIRERGQFTKQRSENVYAVGDIDFLNYTDYNRNFIIMRFNSLGEIDNSFSLALNYQPGVKYLYVTQYDLLKTSDGTDVHFMFCWNNVNQTLVRIIGTTSVRAYFLPEDGNILNCRGIWGEANFYYAQYLVQISDNFYLYRINFGPGTATKRALYQYSYKTINTVKFTIRNEYSPILIGGQSSKEYYQNPFLVQNLNDTTLQYTLLSGIGISQLNQSANYNNYFLFSSSFQTSNIPNLYKEVKITDINIYTQRAAQQFACQPQGAIIIPTISPQKIYTSVGYNLVNLTVPDIFIDGTQCSDQIIQEYNLTNKTTQTQLISFTLNPTLKNVTFSLNVSYADPGPHYIQMLKRIYDTNQLLNVTFAFRVLMNSTKPCTAYSDFGLSQSTSYRSLTYVLGTNISYDFSQFGLNLLGVTCEYNIDVNITPEELQDTLISYDPINKIINIYSLDYSLMTVYNQLNISYIYYNPLDYQPYLIFEILVKITIDGCDMDAIVPISLDDTMYIVESGIKNINFTKWTLDCQYLVYSIRVDNAQESSDFISFNNDQSQIEIFTNSVNNVGSYSIYIYGCLSIPTYNARLQEAYEKIEETYAESNFTLSIYTDENKTKPVIQQDQIEIEELKPVRSEDFYDLKVKLNSISESGKLYAEFQPELQYLLGQSQKNEKYFHLKLSSDINFTWSIAEISKNKMTVQMKFDDISQVSKNYLWGMVNQIQIITHLPLNAVDIPTNTKYFFNIIIDISNFNVIPSEYLLEQLMEVEETEPLNVYFSDMDIFENLMKIYFQNSQLITLQQHASYFKKLKSLKQFQFVHIVVYDSSLCCSVYYFYLHTINQKYQDIEEEEIQEKVWVIV
eukprot:403344950